MRLDAPWLHSDPSRQVVALLEQAGHSALFVGGCVRNALLGAPVSDLDLSTDARPQRVMDLAKAAGIKAIPTGFDHGTVTLVVAGTPFEVTTYRRDVATDGRRAVVAFADTVEEDAARRDFTMNALYADGRGQVIDPLGGLPDLAARRLRFIGDAPTRIREDYLRILRFFRFHAWYGAPGIDAEGLAACAAHAEGLGQIAKERIGQEMLKLLGAPDPAPAVASMQSAGVLMRCLPGADGRALAPLVHLEQIAGVAPSALRRLALIGGEAPGPNLRLSKADDKALITRVGLIGADQGPDALGYWHGEDVARDVLLLRAAALGGPVPQAEIAQASRAAQQTLPITAADLMPPLSGASLGATLKRVTEQWIASGFTLGAAELRALALEGKET